LSVDPQDAFTNIQNLRSRYNIYDRYGFFDAVNPTTGQVGHRYLVLDQSMIMAALDNALRANQMQQHFAQDPVIAAVQPYLAEESFSIP
ncbi:MAG TPA: glucoamylase family protein, partial [Ktedonobacteraceae bacterium]|nr:glucoamylase family protein [Ktedonobacteraceae bacterium]